MIPVLRPAAVAIAAGALLAVVLPAAAQNTSRTVPPVIDVHFHAMEDSPPTSPPMCPNTSRFVASDPKTQEAQFGWIQEECTPKLYPAAKGQYMKEVIADMERLNVTAVVFGSPDQVKKWQDAAPGRVIPGTGFAAGGKRPPVAELRTTFTSGGFKVMGEIGLQYEGISPSDMSVDQYFAFAEELDIPVAIHMGTGGSGRANISRSTFRGSMGNPLLLEELLARHPKLRVQVMHAGYPMAENMFGTDQLVWPKLMAYSISIIQNADYLTTEQKRDILYNNAARFLRIEARPAPAQ